MGIFLSTPELSRRGVRSSGQGGKLGENSRPWPSKEGLREVPVGHSRQPASPDSCSWEGQGEKEGPRGTKGT